MTLMAPTPSSKGAEIIAGAVLCALLVSGCSAQGAKAPTSQLSESELAKIKPNVVSQEMLDTPKSPVTLPPSTFVTKAAFQVRGGKKTGPAVVTAKPGAAVTLVVGVDSASELVIEGTNVRVVVQSSPPNEGVAVVVPAPQKSGSYPVSIAGYAGVLFTLVVAD